MTLQDIGVVVAIVTAILAAALSIIMFRPQRKKLKAETAQIFQDMLADELEKSLAKDSTILGMDDRIAYLEAELDKLRIINDKLSDENRDLRDENYDLKDWATRLVQQVVDAKKTPVKIRKRNT